MAKRLCLLLRLRSTMIPLTANQVVDHRTKGGGYLNRSEFDHALIAVFELLLLVV